jgi:hypothetical protein
VVLRPSCVPPVAACESGPFLKSGKLLPKILYVQLSKTRLAAPNSPEEQMLRILHDGMEREWKGATWKIYLASSYLFPSHLHHCPQPPCKKASEVGHPRPMYAAHVEPPGQGIVRQQCTALFSLGDNDSAVSPCTKLQCHLQHHRVSAGWVCFPILFH